MRSNHSIEATLVTACPFTGALNKIADLKMAAPLSPCHEESELDLWFAFFVMSK
jgi:hypothetical protein